MTKRFLQTKFAPVDVLVLVFVCLFFMFVVHLAGSNSRLQEYRITCQNNLSTIGKAIQIYANDYEGEFPRAGGRNTQWADRIADWQAPNRFLAYHIASDGTGGFATISSSLYLLVKYADVSLKTFICPGDSGMTVFNPAEEGAGDRSPIQLWDFGYNPSNHYSYAYHMPYGLYALTTSSEPGMAVAADRNPWMSLSAETVKDFGKFNPDGDREAIKAGNAIAHEDEGQNVLFVDGHVSFETQSFCGINNDNIYTYQQPGDLRIGIPPMFFASMPGSKSDSLLVNEPGIYKQTETKQPETVNTSDLERTSVVATLDCPMPEHRNVIWCSTFQMAWDKMKNDIIGEPIQVIGAEKLVERLNQAEFSEKDLEEESYYANVGIIGEGIIEQIQKEMAKRFPSEPLPVFDEESKIPSNSILAYSYLNVDLEFEYPFYINDTTFAFKDSSGTRTDVTSFCNFSEIEDQNLKKVSEQVDILYYKQGQQREDSEFAVDLCKQLQPYQVILAIVPWRATLTEIIAEVEQKTSEFKLDPNYEDLRKLRAKGKLRGRRMRPQDIGDELIVPDVLYKLTHRFKELLGKNVSNQKLAGPIFEAMQKIDFSLSRTGIVLKSEARFGIAAVVVGPRSLYFNRPFLIYVKKRGDDYSPFFVMWVDNTELMKEYN